MPAIWPNPSSHWRPGEGQSSRCRAACSRSRPPNSSARCMAGSGRTARAAWPRCSPKTGTPRRAISPLTPVAGRPQPMMMTRRLCAAGSRNRSRGNALMREVGEVAEKDPGADLRRLSNREKTLLIDRLRPAYSPGSMACLPGIAPSGHLLPPRPARR